MSKDKIKKTRCPKNYALKETEVATLGGVSVSYVKKIRAGFAQPNTPKAQRVLVIDKIANQNKSTLIQEIERIVKL